MHRPFLPVILVLALAAAACEEEGEQPDAAHTAASIIYGDDDRLDAYQLGDDVRSAWLRERADNSVAAMVFRWNIQNASGGRVELSSSSYGATYDLCNDQRFIEQPSAAACSGTLIAEDLILTAGHCVTSQQDCDDVAWVFNYQMEDADTLRTLYTSDVFECAELVVSFDGFTANNRHHDYAVVRLDRSAAPSFAPAPLGFAHSVQSDARVSVLGFGAGLPLKIDSGGAVYSARSYEEDYFVATTDTFGGNSGSGVFNDNGELVGILVRGNDDFQEDNDRQCNVVNEVKTTFLFAFSEQITYAMRAVDALCNEPDYNAHTLCEPLAIPNGWTCDDQEYADATYCDCDCGIPDPDCEFPARPTRGCGEDPPAEEDTCPEACTSNAEPGCAECPESPGETPDSEEPSSNEQSDTDDDWLFGCTTTPRQPNAPLLLTMLALITVLTIRRQA